MTIAVRAFSSESRGWSIRYYLLRCEGMLIVVHFLLLNHNHTRANCRLVILRVWNWKSHIFCGSFRYTCNFWSFAGGFRGLVRVFLVPRAHDPSGLWQGSRALAWPDILRMRRVFVLYSQPIRFARFDGKSVNRGLPVLDQARPELSIPATGQKDRGLWGREWVRVWL